MKRGKNNVSIACKLEVINVIRKYAGDAEQNEAFWLIKRALQEIPEFQDIAKKHGQKLFDEIVKHYSKTNLQQRAERKLKEEEKRIREEAREKIDKLRAEGYSKQSEVASHKREDGINELLVERERLQKKLPDCPNEGNKKWTENRIEEIDRELKTKGAEQA